MPKPRLCKCGCGQLIPEGNTLRKAATVECAIVIARADIESRERKEIAEAKKKLKTRQQWLKDVQTIFNKYIRLRDYGQPCISCGRSNPVKQNAGHYRTVKASPELRFNPDNCHLQCEHCNTYLSGNIREYTPRLIEKIGQVRFDRINGPQEQKKWTIDELIELKRQYQAKVRELEKDRL